MIDRLMNEEIQIVPFAQNFTSITMPCAERNGCCWPASSQLQHSGNPVLRWNAANVAILGDSQGNLKPDKVGSLARIDGIVAILNALGRAMVHSTGGESSYEVMVI